MKLRIYTQNIKNAEMALQLMGLRKQGGGEFEGEITPVQIVNLSEFFDVAICHSSTIDPERYIMLDEKGGRFRQR